MSRRYSQYNAGREPHSVSLKVLRLSRPSLATQFPVQPPPSLAPSPSRRDQQASIPASLAFNSSPIRTETKLAAVAATAAEDDHDDSEEETTTGDDDGTAGTGQPHHHHHQQYTYRQEWRTNPEPFILSPILQLPPSFGSAYVGETFSCTLCANHDVPVAEPEPGQQPQQQQQQQQHQHQSSSQHEQPNLEKMIRDVRIEAEMKTPSSSIATRLDLGPATAATAAVTAATKDDDNSRSDSRAEGTDLEPGQTLQRVVSFNLKEEGNHVLAVTVSYYEATEVSGRTRTFRKLYQFICKSSLIVRTKAGPLVVATATAPLATGKGGQDGAAQVGQSRDEKGEEESKRNMEKNKNKKKRRRWVLEAQLENCSEEAMQLERVGLEPEPGLACAGCNWDLAGAPGGERPVLHPGDVEQVCFVVEEEEAEEEAEEEEEVKKKEKDDDDDDDNENESNSSGGGLAGGSEQADGRLTLGILSIGWRGEMGSRGSLSTGKLMARPLPKTAGSG